MTNSAEHPPTKKQRQNAAREHARLLREEAERKARRRRLVIQGSVGVGILVVLAVIAIVVVQLAKPAVVSGAGPKNMISDGIVLTSTTSYVATGAIPDGGKPTPTTQPDDGKAHITIYEDLQCPVCKAFEEANDAQLARWLDAGTATVEIHPISILDRMSSGNRYSTRAANAMACIAQYDPTTFWQVNKTFYDEQPEEGGNGKTDDQILATIKTGGSGGSSITTCVNKETFTGWVTSATNRIIAPGTKIPNSNVTVSASGFGTPTVIVNGKAYTPPNNTLGYADAKAFAAFVKSVAPKIE